jgi:hypothetical protein
VCLPSQPLLAQALLCLYRVSSPSWPRPYCVCTVCLPSQALLTQALLCLYIVSLITASLGPGLIVSVPCVPHRSPSWPILLYYSMNTAVSAHLVILANENGRGFNVQPGQQQAGGKVCGGRLCARLHVRLARLMSHQHYGPSYTTQWWPIASECCHRCVFCWVAGPSARHPV